MMAVVAQQQKGIRRALTEAEVRATVQEAIDDTDDCLISPVWGLINYGAANRHHKRYIAVMGIATKAASMAKVVFGAGGLILLLLVAMLINSTYPWWTDMLLAALIGGSVAFPLKFMITYRGAFSRIVVHEHRDFTEPSQGPPRSTPGAPGWLITFSRRHGRATTTGMASQTPPAISWSRRKTRSPGWRTATWR